jgi:predicted acetyltransferase
MRQLGLEGYPVTTFDGKVRNHILHEGPEGADGLLTWVPGRPVPETHDPSVEVLELFAASDAAYRDLWAYITSLDLVGQIRLHRRPVDEPVRWLLPDARALRGSYVADGLWLRLLDVPAALSARRYQVADRLVLEVVDDDAGGFAAGRYVLDGGPDGAKCQASTVDTPDLRVHQRALAMAYLGGTSLQSQLIAGRVEELTAGALRRADAMFLTPTAPWCATGF